jgi:hypothetical protein
MKSNSKKKEKRKKKKKKTHRGSLTAESFLIVSKNSEGRKT